MLTVSGIFRRLSKRRRKFAIELRKSDASEEMRLLVRRHLVAQYYVRDEEDAFYSTLAELRRHQDVYPGYFVRAKFLADVLEANLCFESANYDKAEHQLRKIIGDIKTEHSETQAGLLRLRERPKLEFLSIVLALLYNNLGQTLSKKDPSPETAIEAFKKGIELQPNMIMLRENLAFHFIDHQLWNEAENAFRGAYLCSQTDKNRDQFTANSAYLNHTKAEWLSSNGHQHEAVEVAKDSLEQLAAAGALGWIGKFHFLLGSIYADQGKATEAAQNYLESSRSYERAEDASSASYVREARGDFHVKRAEFDFAGADYDASLKLIENGEEKAANDKAETERLGLAKPRVLAKRALTGFSAGRNKEAASALDDCRALLIKLGWTEPLRQIVRLTTELLDQDNISMRFKLYLDGLLARADDAAVRRDLIFSLRALYRRTGKYVTTPDDSVETAPDRSSFPVTLPIAIEIDVDFLDRAGGSDCVIDEFAPAMRERVQQLYGVKVPGIRLRGNETDFPFGTYLLMIHEVPLASNTIEIDKRLCPATAADLDRIGVDERQDTVTPNGEAAFWISEPHWAAIEDAGLPLWQILDYPIRHMEALIVSNLVEFLGHQEVQNLLETKKLVLPETNDILAKETFEHMDPVTNILRALVQERVPITAFEEIYDIIRDHMLKQVSPGDTIDAIRNHASILPRLWGNDDSYRFYKLGARLLAVVQQAIRDEGQVLALEPELAQEILSTIRDGLAGAEKPAIVVPSQSPRCLLRKLIEIEFPQVPVLSLKELKVGLGPLIVGTIELAGEQ